MLEVNEYARVLMTLYEKSLILEETSDFHPILGFWFFDALSHLDYTISLLAFNPHSPRNLLSREYIRYRTEVSLTGDHAKFPGFIAWLQMNHQEMFEIFPLFIQKIYSPADPAAYRSFRIILNPDEKSPLPPGHLSMMIDEMFDRAYLSSLYNGSKIAQLFEHYISTL
ncbi:MAG TPA: hypothetical protein VN372_13750 [Methanospirillum sp.]|nr:hypothetical protein [Methanospirillum sp.]